MHKKILCMEKLYAIFHKGDHTIFQNSSVILIVVSSLTTFDKFITVTGTFPSQGFSPPEISHHRLGQVSLGQISIGQISIGSVRLVQVRSQSRKGQSKQPAIFMSEFLKRRYNLPPCLTSLPIRHYFYSNCILSYKYELTIQIN